MAIMKAISIHHQYVIDIIDGLKTEEYRIWPTKHRGDMVICVTADNASRGYSCLVVDVYDCVKDGDVYAFKLRNVRAIKPFVVKGQQRIYNLEVPDDLEFFSLDEEFCTVDEELEFIMQCWKKPPTKKELEELRVEIETARGRK